VEIDTFWLLGYSSGNVPEICLTDRSWINTKWVAKSYKLLIAMGKWNRQPHDYIGNIAQCTGYFIRILLNFFSIRNRNISNALRIYYFILIEERNHARNY